MVLSRDVLWIVLVEVEGWSGAFAGPCTKHYRETSECIDESGGIILWIRIIPIWIWWAIVEKRKPVVIYILGRASKVRLKEKNDCYTIMWLIRLQTSCFGRAPVCRCSANWKLGVFTGKFSLKIIQTSHMFFQKLLFTYWSFNCNICADTGNDK